LAWPDLGPASCSGFSELGQGELETMKILVTGGAGYIGSIVTEQLVAAGESVVVLDNLAQGHRAAVHPEAAFVQGNLCERVVIDAVLREHQPEAIMHFASNTLVGESVEKPFLYLGDNVANGLNLLESAVKHGVRRFILSSTANLFDAPVQIPISEKERIVPGSPYGESKHILERILYWLDRLCGLRYATLRYFNAAGASEERGEDHHPETHIIPIVLQVALGKRDKVIIFGNDYPTRDGTCVRDYIHVLDLAQAHILALYALDKGSRVYNLGNGQGFTVKEVIEVAREVTGHPIPAEVGARRPGDPPELVASSDRIRLELGWEPRYPNLEEIVGSAWRWHQTHPNGYPAR
jgi:UDP-glucose 4-epimerase